MKIKKIAIGFGALLGLGVLIILAGYFYELSFDQTFMLINGDTLLIKEASEWEVSKPYTYQIRRKDKIVIPESVFFHQGQDAEEPIFELVYSDDKKMMAVVTKQNPKIVHILYDFETETSIPHREGNEESTDFYLRCDKMLEKFNRNKQDYNLSKYF